MGLTKSQRKAVTKATATRYRRADKAGKTAILGELDIDDAGAALLCSMSAATSDRRLAAARSKLLVRGRSQTKPGSLLKDAIGDPDLGPVGRCGARLRRDRPGWPRGRQRFG